MIHSAEAQARVMEIRARMHDLQDLIAEVHALGEDPADLVEEWIALDAELLVAYVVRERTILG